MKRILVFLITVSFAIVSYAQPSFALVGYGAGTTGGQGGSTVTVTDYAGLAAAGTTQIKVLADGIFTAGNSDFLFSKAALAAGTYTWKLMSGVTVVKTGGVILP